MLIKFLGTHRISEDGHTTRVCEIGKEYDVADSAARDALNKGWAYCTEPEEPDWFENFLESIRPPSREQLERILRPVPTNPATTGEV